MNVYVCATAACIAASGTPTDVFTRRIDPAAPAVVELATNLRVVHVEAGPGDLAKAKLPAWTSVFARGVEDFAEASGIRYGGLLSHYWLSGLVACSLADSWDVPHVAAFHTLALAKQAAFPDDHADRQDQRLVRVEGERRIVREADALLAAGTHERDELVLRYRAEAEKIRLAPPGVDRDLFHPRDRQACRSRLGLAPDRPLVLTVGRDVAIKGADVLERAHALLPALLPADRRPDALFIGGEADGARRIGAVPQEELAWYYGAADVAVAPSYYESFGMAALEAQACGRAVVASEVGGLPAVVEHGRTGLLVPPGDHEALAAAVSLLLKDRPQAERLGQAAAHSARGRTWRAAADSALDALRADRLVRVSA